MNFTEALAQLELKTPSAEEVQPLMDTGADVSRAEQAKTRSDEALKLSEGVKSFKADTEKKQIDTSYLANLWQRSAKKWREAEKFWTKAADHFEHFYEHQALWNELLGKVYEGIAQKIHEKEKIPKITGNYLSSDILDKAYKEACAKGTVRSFRAKLDIIGHTDVGKTSLSHRLLGQPFVEQKESTEGIATHVVKSKFYPKDMTTGLWFETTNDAEELVAKFNNEIFMKYDDYTQQSHANEIQANKVRKLAPRTDCHDKKNNTINRVEKNVDRNTKDTGDHFFSNENLRSDTTTIANDDIPNVSDVNHDEHETKITSTTTIPSVGEILQEEDVKENVKNIEIQEMPSKTRQKLLSQYQSRSHSSRSHPSTTAAIDYSLHLWDFGGHTEFLATHHLFMNVESTTLILLDISKDFNQPIKKSEQGSGVGIPSTPENFLHYWLSTIYSQVSQNQLEPNIALVLTHKDMIQVTSTDDYIEQYITEIRKSISDKPYSKYITNENIFVIDNKNGNENEFSKLRSKVFEMIVKQKSWGIERPVRWLKLEADILDKASQRKYLALSDVMVLASVLGIDEVELQSFLKFHHVLGDFIYYVEPGLRKIVITDPQWLADMFKTLITSQGFILERNISSKICEELKQGRVTLNTLEKIWKGNHVQFLIQLFQHFDLLLPILSAVDGDMFIIPCMLPHMSKTIYETSPFKTMVLSYNSQLSSKSKEPFKIGIFHHLLSQCSKNWNICAEDHLSYSDASFEITQNVRLAVTLQGGNLIRTSIWCQRDCIDGEIIELILKSRAKMESLAHTYHIEPNDDSFLMLCPHATPEEEFICLVKVKEVHDPKTSEITLWSTEKCHIHKKDVINYEIPSPDKALTEKTQVQEKLTGLTEVVPSLKILAFEVSPEALPNAAHWGTSPMTTTINGKKYIATVSHGEACVLKDPESDVSMHIPQGSTGVFWKCVHTDHSRFRTDIPDEECTITPLVEIHHHDASDDVDLLDRGNFVIKIPHCIPHKEMWKLVKVRKWKNGNVSQELIKKDVMGGEGDYFVMEEQSITVVTQHFCALGGTICDKDGCRSTLRIILVAKLEGREWKNLTTVKIKSFLCSRLLSLHDFRKNLLYNQRSLGLTKVEEGDLHLEPKHFDPKKAVLTMVLKAAQTESIRWQPCEDDDTLWIKEEGHFQKESILQQVIDYTPCPCKSINQDDPVAAMVVNMKAEGLRQDFDGRFDITARTLGDQEGDEQKISKETIQFTVSPRRGLSHGYHEDTGMGNIQTGARKRTFKKPKHSPHAPSLTDSMLLEVACKLTREPDIYRVGLNLGLKHTQIQENIKNNRDEITMAAYYMLQTWKKQHQDHQQAFTDLETALGGDKLSSIVDEVRYGN